MSNMQPRERVLRAMRRQKPDRVPCQAAFPQPLLDLLRQKAGESDIEAYFMERGLIDLHLPQPIVAFFEGAREHGAH